MPLPEGVVMLNRMIEEYALKEEFETLEKLSFVRQQIINHTCEKKKK